MPEQLSIEISGESPVVVQLVGELDLGTAPALAEALTAVNGADVVVDCHSLRFLDSTGISLLVDLHRHQERGGHRLVLRDVDGLPRRSLEICGLTQILGVDSG